MDIITILFIAVGLSMDAFAVSIARGFAMEKLHVKHAIRIAFFFGLFQFLMPLVGWLCGAGLKNVIAGVDHWIAFALLSFIGVKMIYESTKLKEDKDCKKVGGCISLRLLLILSVATSIDALAVGLSLSLLGVAVIFPAVVIGVVTFIFSFFGVVIGERFGHFFESKIEIFGGIILIGIGTKILIQHL